MTVRYNRKDLVDFNKDKIQLGPEIRGMSGCGIWRFVKQRVNVDTWRAESACKLVAIATCWDLNRKIVMGTKADVIMMNFKPKGSK